MDMCLVVAVVYRNFSSSIETEKAGPKILTHIFFNV